MNVRPLRRPGGKRAVRRFYPVVGSAVWVERLIPHGARFIQLRVDDRSEEHVLTEVRAALEICQRYGARLVVKDHWRIAIDEGADFIHLEQRDLEIVDVPALRRARIRIGIGVDNVDELDRVLAVGPDYAAFGPIFPTESNETSGVPRGLARIVEWKRRLGSVALVATGGLNPERARAAIQAGADAAALTDIEGHPQPEQRAREWVAAVETGPRGLMSRVRARRA